MFGNKLEGELKKASKNWTMPVVIRVYEGGDKGARLAQEEAAILVLHGYEISAQSEEGGHIHAGRILLTGGLSIFAGKKGTRAGGRVTMTYKLVPADTAGQLHKLVELHDAGALTDEEFEAKRAALVDKL